jgi:hypothetical protein
MLSLVAISRADGWAVVRDGKHLLLVHPPYTRIGQRPVDEDYVETAVSRLAFQRPQQPMDFSGWQPLIAHLNGEVEKARSELGQSMDDAGLSERLLALAPLPVLRGFVERARNELLPDPLAWAGAERLLLALLRLPQVSGSPELHGAALDLLSDLTDAKGERDRALAQTAVNIQRFPRIAGRWDAALLNQYLGAVTSQPNPMVA